MSGGYSTPPLGRGQGPLRRSGRGGGGDGSGTGGGSGGSSTPPFGGGSGGPLRRSGKGGDGEGSGGNSTPPIGGGGSGPLRRSGKGGGVEGSGTGSGSGSAPSGRRSHSGGDGSSGIRPRPTPSITTFGSFLANAAYTKKSKKRGALPVTQDQSTDGDGTPSETVGIEPITGKSAESSSQGNTIVPSDSAAQVPTEGTGSRTVGIETVTGLSPDTSSQGNLFVEQPHSSDSAAELPTDGIPSKTVGIETITGQSSDTASQGNPFVDRTLGNKKSSTVHSSSAAQIPTDGIPSKTVGIETITGQSSDTSSQGNPLVDNTLGNKKSTTASGSAAQIPVRNDWSTQPVSRVPATQAQIKREALKAQFREFLENPDGKKGLKGESLGKYEAQVKIMALCENHYVLDVKFEDILKDKKNADLAMEIANDSNRDHEWLQEVAQDFMMKSFKEEDRNKLRLNITGKPQSMLRMKSISLRKLVRVVKLSIGGLVHAPTPFGRNVYLCVLLHILDNHAEGISWRGLIELEDIFILTYQDMLRCWIAKETSWEGKEHTSYLDRCTTGEKVLDLNNLDNVLTGCYKDGDTVPLYFDRLSLDLQNVGVIFLDENPWFITYLRFHVALMSSMARKFLIDELFLLMSTHKLLSVKDTQNESGVFAAVLAWIHDLWSKNDPLLLAVYKYENPLYEDDKTTTKKGKSDATKGKGVVKEKFDRYIEKLGSALSYKRHLLWHTHNNIDNPKLLGDEEVELFAASKLPQVLPKVICDLLEENNMTGRFAKVWSAYCAMRSDKEGEVGN